ncbi:MAG TPA: rhodanese-like domain-containing protein, partial [Streptosporangiaceae bacterium]|nr:rhodanese-like domain-containing protein [Streptosporangiaceae bacterium]
MNPANPVPEIPAAGLPDGAFLLDVREDEEWVAGHAPDALHIPLGQLGSQVDQVPRDREVYVVCRAGSRSAYAAQ